MTIPSAAIICACRDKGRCHAYFETTTSATSASVGSPPSISRAGAGAWMMPATASAPVRSQARHALLGPARHDHPDLRRDLVEPLGAILADDVQFAAAAGAYLGLRLDHDLLARQMRRKVAAIDLAQRPARR